jgi:very-short-patch-repair endonuclease
VIIEADGGQHAEQGDYDAQRTAALERLGFRVLRFWNHEILTETEAVLERIRRVLFETPSPCPSPGGRGDPSTGRGS